MTCQLCGLEATDGLELEAGFVCVECLEQVAGEAAGTRGPVIVCDVARPSNCWLPSGRGRAEDGRAIVRMDGRKTYLYTAVWESLMGKPPENLTPDHTCLDPRCVNPTHIEWVTREENASRSWTRGRRKQ